MDVRSVPTDEIEVLSQELRFTDVRDVVVSDASIWVLDLAPPFVTRLDRSDGSVVRFGSRGQGPGEFDRPVALQVEPDIDIAHVWDLGNATHVTVDAMGGITAVERLSADGIPSGRDNIRKVSYADPHRIRLLGEHAVLTHFPNGVNRTADFTSASLRTANQRLEPVDELVSYSGVVEQTPQNLREFGSIPLWDVCGGSSVVVWRPGTADLLWLETGQASDSLSLDLARNALQLTHVESYLRSMARLEVGPGYEAAGVDFQAMARQHRDRFVTHAPLVTDVRCGCTGTAWLQLFDAREDPLGHGARWLRIGRGEAVRSLEFPSEFRPMAVTGQGVVGLYQAPQGFQQLAVWRGTSLSS